MKYYIPPDVNVKGPLKLRPFQKGLVSLSDEKAAVVVKFPRSCGMTTSLAFIALREAERVPSRKIIFGSPYVQYGRSFLDLIRYLRANRKLESPAEAHTLSVRVSSSSQTTMTFSNNSIIQCFSTDRLYNSVRGHRLSMVLLDDFGHLTDKYQRQLMSSVWPCLSNKSTMFLTGSKSNSSGYFDELWQAGKNFPITDEEKVFHRLSGKEEPWLKSFEVLPDLSYRIGYECK